MSNNKIQEHEKQEMAYNLFWERKNIQAGIYPKDDDQITIGIGEWEQPRALEVGLEVSEIKDLISFLQTLINDLTEEE